MQLINFIICDDTRQEVGKKVSLMGVYNDEMSVEVETPDAPFSMRFGVYARVRYEPEDPRPDSVHIEIRYNNQTVLAQDASVDTREALRGTALTFNVPRVELSGAGDLSVELGLYFHGSLLADPYKTDVRIVPVKRA